jgi:hypothetical protein
MKTGNGNVCAYSDWFMHFSLLEDFRRSAEIKEFPLHPADQRVMDFTNR